MGIAKINKFVLNAQIFARYAVKAPTESNAVSAETDLF
jgi:hypothetical protein